MRFLVIGLGSAGQRHARVIRSLFPSATIDAYIGAHRTGLIAEDLKSIDYTVTPMDFYGLNQVKALDGIRDKYDLTVIATPINSHFEYFDKTKEISKRFIIEKPIGNSVSESEKILEFAMSYNLPVLIGYQQSFNPLVRTILDYCRSRDLPNSIQITFHEYLRSMNPFRDMSTHHLANEGGGGVLLALSHELDILLQIRKIDIAKLRIELGKSNEFHNVIDYASITLDSLVSTDLSPEIKVSLSFSQGEKERHGQIDWQDQTLIWNFLSGEVTFKDKAMKSNVLVTKMSGDQLFAMQLLFLLNKSSFDSDLFERLNRAINIVRIYESALN